MGASESKLVFKQGIFRLSEDRRIKPDDAYWQGFWELPESVEDVFSLFSPNDIRRTRDASIENLETLILAVTSQLNTLKNHPSFPDPELAPERDALNCVRVLTRILPFVYEADHLAEWEEKFFWGPRRRKSRRAQIAGEVLFDESQRDDTEEKNEEVEQYEDAKPLAEELLDTLVDLLFFQGFTLPHLPNTKSRVTYAIWQSGVGSKQSISTNKDLESNRCEVLRLLLTMMSKSMYMSSALLPVKGVRAITYLATCADKQIVLSVLCSLLNTAIKYNAASWRIPYDHMVWKDSRQSLVVYSLQMLLVLLLYPIPEDGQTPAPKNFYRHFLGRLHRPEDFQFLADGMTRALSQPMQATSYIPGTQRQSKWAPEMIMLFWEVLQCNKRFRAFIIESNRMHDFVILMLFYAIEHKTDLSWQGVVRMCVFVLQTMSVEPAFGKNLNKKFEAQETLPTSIRLTNFRGSYADFLIISIHTLITTSKGRLDAIYPALLAIISNMAAYAQNLSMTTSTKLLQLFATMSSPSFLLANENNHALLQSLLEAINTMTEHQYGSNPNLIYVVLRSRKRIEALRTFTLEGGQQEMERVARRRKEGVDSPSTESFAPPSRTGTNETLGPPSRTNTDRSTDTTVEDNTFTIGGDEDSDDDVDRPTPSQSSQSHNHSRAPSTASSSAEDAVPLQLRGMSEKARGKMPAGAQSFSRQASTTSLARIGTGQLGGFVPTAEWIETWLPELPLHTLLTLTKALSPRLPPSSNGSTASNDNSRLIEFLQSLPESAQQPAISAILSAPSPIRVHLFEWSTLSLGWYTSVLWSLIYAGEMHVAPAASTTASTISNTVTGNASMGIGPIGVWNGTQVKLFQVSTEGKREGPSLSAPRGAVDAVGTRLVDGVKGLKLGGLMGRINGTGINVASPTLGNNEGQGRGSMREV
ncbi:hypothetical protein PMZ80_006310 [Knufia obscura]|uniref:High-temperature-induced dauer-formation protein n=2 Tax=Knufia TaxID=430999 RepID=A0AAN8F8Y9_9EURO|nr:hypothetical protein PMZ80_006310 [Knufia obscura]KAK5953546.1 hypothetical protein OHC33_005490 [Knufia fluminis]